MEVCTVYDGIVYIVKKCINIFSKRGFLNVGTILPRVGNIVPPPSLHKCSRTPRTPLVRESHRWNKLLNTFKNRHIFVNV